MSIRKKSIGILGGTFDPVHHGHLRLALECLQQAELDEVRFIPLKVHPFNKSPQANDQQRLAMLQLAMAELSEINIDERELKRDGASYTIDTLRSLRDEYPDAALCLIIGNDAFQQLDKWNEWKSLLDVAHIIVADRPSDEIIVYNKTIEKLLEKHETKDAKQLCCEAQGYILKVAIPLLDISSTMIRSNYAAQRNNHFLLPDTVMNYIAREKLYA